MTLDLLWTDKCFLFLVAISVICVCRALRKAPVRRACLAIFRKPIAVSAAVILCFFVSVAVLDSVRLKDTTSHHTFSVLDKIVSPIDTVYEKTYSAPLALTLYSSETRVVDGEMEKVYPRLAYPPAKLQNHQDVMQLLRDILLVSALVACLSVLALWGARVCVRRIQSNRWQWRPSAAVLSALVTLMICLWVIMASYWLSRYLHVLGTGKIGQDVFYYAIKSIRTGLVIGTLTTLFMMPLALLLGIAAGYFGGVVDDIIQYVYTTLSSIPGVLLITASVLSMQTYIANHPEQFTSLAGRADARLFALCIILGVTSWTSLCRLLRAEVLKLREIDYVLAAQALSTSTVKILWRHLLPNVMHIVLITLVLDFSFLVLAEAVLSYVGVGVSPLTISWGNMINAARLELAREPIVWWPVLAAFIFMFVLVLASNLFADAVRDAFDPRNEGRS